MTIKNESTWDVDMAMPRFSSLARSIVADVVIVGGGITGVSCAYLLSKAGKKVVLLEESLLGSGATGVTTAFLTQYLDTSLSKLVQMYGKKKTAMIAESHQFAINEINRIVKTHDFDCEFVRCPNYIYATSRRFAEGLKKEGKIAKSLGISLGYKEGRALKFRNYGYLELIKQGKFHPMKYLSALARTASNQGTFIFEGTSVEDIEGNSPFVVKTKKGEIMARDVIVATYSPFNRKPYFKKVLYKSYVLEVEIPLDCFKEGIYEDTQSPYHYFRVDKGLRKDRMIIGGEDHRSDIRVHSSKSFEALKDYLEGILQRVDYKIVRRWKGPIIEPVDGLAYIGKSGDGKYYATGFSGNGMTYSIIAAHIITNKILKKKEIFPSVYDVSRLPSLNSLIGKGVDYSKELIGGAVKNTLVYRKGKRKE